MLFKDMYFSFIDSLIFNNFISILSALDQTLLLLLISLPIGFILSLIFALLRVSKNKFLSKPIAAYIFIIRGTPLLVQIYLIYFGLGSVKYIRDSFLWIILKEPFWCGVLALTINTVAYGSEIFRGGIQSVSKGQIESGKSLGFSIDFERFIDVLIISNSFKKSSSSIWK